MATNKNQHFVPRCYLRQFTSDGNDKSISLYNIERNRFIEGAPVKNQCSGDYFYGKDPLLEEAIQAIEQSYATAIREIIRPGYQLTDEHCSVLQLFWLMQHLRTEAASKRAVEMSNSMASIVESDHVDFKLQIRDAVQIAMQAFYESMDIVSDLRVCLVKNRSNIPFITSDDPAVLSNRWHLQIARKTGLSFGLNSAGALLFLPISPTILFLAYDQNIYNIPSKKGWVDLRRDVDANAFNQHQFLNCRANLFVKNPQHFELIQTAFLEVFKHRPPARHRMHYAVLDKTGDGYERYVVVDYEKAGQHETAIIHTQAVHTVPTTWPQQVLWRADGSYFYNGTGVGYVRQASAPLSGTSPFSRFRAFP
ncbi:DUF4238 domain-containing protein [Burkholderia aenigmatica]|uniref:DUF4238 domain-containing protein n=1 Tax=Burkholderia aenigmatica TaxID=2015348 RepID=UPI00264F0577|nr:DUF4238 domain-containing protein [Burkholderia aenigmatica]MDN7874244.1 DUF4238 domain-containing protein [Burkholderia aenigmatica]